MADTQKERKKARETGDKQQLCPDTQSKHIDNNAANHRGPSHGGLHTAAPPCQPPTPRPAATHPSMAGRRRRLALVVRSMRSARVVARAVHQARRPLTYRTTSRNLRSSACRHGGVGGGVPAGARRAGVPAGRSGWSTAAGRVLPVGLEKKREEEDRDDEGES